MRKISPAPAFFLSLRFIRIFFVLIVLAFAFCPYCTTHNTNIHAPCPRRDSNPQFQQAIGRRPSPYTARPLRSAGIRSPNHPARRESLYRQLPRPLLNLCSSLNREDQVSLSYKTKRTLTVLKDTLKYDNTTGFRGSLCKNHLTWAIWSSHSFFPFRSFHEDATRGESVWAERVEKVPLLWPAIDLLHLHWPKTFGMPTVADTYVLDINLFIVSALRGAFGNVTNAHRWIMGFLCKINYSGCGKKLSWRNLRYCHDTGLEGMKKNETLYMRIGFRNKIQTLHLLNAQQRATGLLKPLTCTPNGGMDIFTRLATKEEAL